MRTNSSTLSSIAYDGINVKLSYTNRHGYDSTNEFGNVRIWQKYCILILQLNICHTQEKKVLLLSARLRLGICWVVDFGKFAKHE